MAERKNLTNNTGVFLPSGLYVQLVSSGNGTATMTLNKEYLMGFWLAPQTIAELAVRVTTGGDASAVVRLGIRVDNAGTPGASGGETTVVATTTGWKNATLNYVHPGGILWTSITGQGWSATAINMDGNVPVMTFPYVTPSALSTLGWAAGHGVVMAAQTGVSGALPSTFVNTQTTNTGQWVLAAKAA